MSNQDWSNDPRARRWLDRVQRELIPMLNNSAIVMNLVPEGEPDVKYAVELGLSIMMDKPIIGVTRPGVHIPQKLARVVDRWIEWVDDPQEMYLRIKAVMKEMGVE